MISNISDKCKFTDKHGAEMAEFAFGLINPLMEADVAINELMRKIGAMLKNDVIVIQELIENDETIKCTYEWRKDGRNALLNIERRFISEMGQTFEEMYDANPEGVFIFNSGDPAVSLKSIIGPSDIKSMLQVPLYKGEQFIGCVDFVNIDEKHEWSHKQIMLAKSFCRFVSSYLFGLRNNENKEIMKELVKVDSVTKLPYYDEFINVVRSGFEADKNAVFVIACADCLNFKYINEKYGFEMGNRILRLFANSVYEYFEMPISCCREYSDNFVLCVKFRKDTSNEQITAKFESFVEYFLNETEKIISDSNIVVNAGICTISREQTDIDATVAYANVARKHARLQTSNKHGKVSMFINNMFEKRREELKLIADLDIAIENEEFKVYFQPKVDCLSRKIVGAEALVRWIKPDGKMIYPDSFIPAFEEDGCIVKLDYYVYETVFKYLRERLDSGLPCVKTSMNVSRDHLFNRAFVSYIDYLINRYKVPTKYLEFEITESVYVDELPSLIYTVEHLKAKGMSLSIDDFGSGYSSLDIITEIPVDVLKLDRVFMKEELSDNDKIIISTVIDMCKRLNVKVLCEGVENEEQMQFLTESCCDEVQGYLFSKPIPIDDFNKLLEKDTEI